MNTALTKSMGQTSYKGDFCSHECQMKFEADPEPYVNAPEAA